MNLRDDSKVIYQIQIFGSFTMARHSLLIIAIILAVSLIASADKILVVLDNAQLKTTHSRLLSLLASPRNNKTKQNQVQIAYSFGPQAISLKNYDRFKYDSIVVMCTSEKQMNSKLKVKDIVSYFDEGGNVIILGDIDTSVSFRKLFFSFGINLDQTGTQIKDHFSNFKQSNIIVTQNFEPINNAFFPTTHQPLLYRGTGLQLVNYENYQLYNLVKAEATAFAKNEIKNQVSRVGSQISLVAGVQGLNNARAILSGSLDFFSDQFIMQNQFGNEHAVKDLVSWTLRKNGQVRVNSMTYFGENAEGKETLFNVGEKIYFEAQIQELDQRSQAWKPYIASDIQVELVMLDPWVRVPLTLADSKTGKYTAEFYAPQKEGIYQFKIIYKKPGYNFVSLAERVTIRPYKHDEFERFLFVAYPYFFGLFSTVLATFAFIIIYLYSSWETKQKEE